MVKSTAAEAYAKENLIEVMFGPDIRKTEFQALLQLDRYAVKDVNRSNIKVGSVIVATVKEPTKAKEHPVKNFGRVYAIDGDQVSFFGTVRETLPKEIALSDPDVYRMEDAPGDGMVYAWKTYTVHRRLVALPLDWQWDEFADRIVQGVIAVEQRFGWHDEEFANRLRDHIKNERFVPGGRIQASIGAKEKYGIDLGYTAYNCYVIPSPKDSRHGIIETLGQMVEIMSRGGGVGINLSTLRPRFSIVYGVNGTSSGAVSWGALFSFATGLVEQAGSRRGALMLQLHCSHPDIFEFIMAKRESGMIVNANLSVQITDEFMDAVIHDRDWHLIFPVTKHPEYDEGWGTKYLDIHDWLNAGLPVEIYDTVKARDLFELIVSSAHASAEPGFVVYDRMNQLMSPTQRLVKDEGSEHYVIDPDALHEYQSKDITPWNNTYYLEKQIATNPCGEQCLPAWGVCNLGHINLSEFVVDGKVDWDMLRVTIHDAVRMLDDVIDYTDYHFEEIRELQLGHRRIGMGTLGLADLLIDLKVRYGSDESIQVISELYRFIANEAYRASALLAKSRGKFPLYDDALLKARIPAKLDKDVRSLIKKYGIRNSHLLTQAPTGTTATKSGRHGYSVSTGIEPYFDLAWIRNSRVGSTVEYLGKAKKFMEETGAAELPSYFVSAMAVKDDGTPAITPREHVNVQAAIQEWNDAAISKTTNVPNNFTVEDTWELYEYGFQKGLVGITIYRDGSRDEQVLESASTKKVDVEDSVGSEGITNQELEGFVPYRRADILPGRTHKIETPGGKMLLTINRNPDNPEIVDEVLIIIGKAGADINALGNGLAISLTGLLSPRIALRSQKDRIKWIIEQFSDISGSTTVGFGKKQVKSVPDAIAKLLKQEFDLDDDSDGESEEGDLGKIRHAVRRMVGNLCPKCGNSTLVKRDGCEQCTSEGCFYSKC